MVDVENLVGSGSPTNHDVARCVTAYRRLRILRHGDHIVVACNPSIGVSVGLSWRSARLLVRRGTSGADLALAEVALRERVDSRFGHVVVASGDGLFVDAVGFLQRRGVTVTVVAPLESLSRRLRMAANRVVPFHLDRDPGAPAVEQRAA
ncbi:MAG: NYN domain-containing protein [Actinobacteria bacterium]|nr:NYN domain-containing protein [Actinomycetota bacterium]